MQRIYTTLERRGEVPPLRVWCQPQVGPDGFIYVICSVTVEGEHLYRVSAASLSTPDGEVSLTPAGEPYPWSPPIGPQAGIPNTVHQTLTARLPSQGGACTIRVTGLESLESGAPAAPESGPWVFPFTLSSRMVTDWHASLPVGYERQLPGGATLRVHRVTFAEERTVVWADLQTGAGHDRPTRLRNPLHMLMRVDGTMQPGLHYQQIEPPVQARLGHPEPTCQAEAMVFPPVAPGESAEVCFGSLHYTVCAPFAVTVAVPPERPAVVSEPLEWSAGGVGLRLDEVMLGRSGSVLFLSGVEGVEGGLQFRTCPTMPLHLTGVGGLYLGARGAGGGGGRFQATFDAVPAGETQLILSGEGPQYLTSGEIAVPLPVPGNGGGSA